MYSTSVHGVWRFISVTIHCMIGRKESNICGCLLWIHAFTNIDVEADLFHEWSVVAWITLCVQQARSRAAAVRQKKVQDWWMPACVMLGNSPISRGVVECKHTLMKFTNPLKTWNSVYTNFSTPSMLSCTFSFVHSGLSHFVFRWIMVFSHEHGAKNHPQEGIKNKHFSALNTAKALTGADSKGHRG